MTIPICDEDSINEAKRLHNLVHKVHGKIFKIAWEERRCDKPPTDQDYILLGKAVIDFMVEEYDKNIKKILKNNNDEINGNNI